jgi:hypothetical protein
MKKNEKVKKVPMLYTGKIKVRVKGIGEVPPAKKGNPVEVNVPVHLAPNLDRDQYWEFKNPGDRPKRPGKGEEKKEKGKEKIKMGEKKKEEKGKNKEVKDANSVE